MKISRLASSTRHCRSLCQQQHAASRTAMSRRIARMLAVRSRSITCSCKLRLRLRDTKSSLKKGAFMDSEQRTPRGSAHDPDPRGVLASAAVLSTPAAGGKLCTATQRMLQNDVLENGNFKPRPKITQSSSRLARLTPSQLVGDGGAVDGGAAGCSTGG